MRACDVSDRWQEHPLHRVLPLMRDVLAHLIRGLRAHAPIALDPRQLPMFVGDDDPSRGRATGSQLDVTIPDRHSPHEITLRSGDLVLVRPIRPDDKQKLLDGFERLSAESRYRRFFSATPKLRAGQVRYLTEVDHHTHEALVAIDPRSNEGLGVARFIRSPDDPAVAEIAVAVVDDCMAEASEPRSCTA